MGFIIKLYSVNLDTYRDIGKLDCGMCQSGVVVKLLYIVEMGRATWDAFDNHKSCM